MAMSVAVLALSCHLKDYGIEKIMAWLQYYIICYTSVALLAPSCHSDFKRQDYGMAPIAVDVLASTKLST